MIRYCAGRVLEMAQARDRYTGAVRATYTVHDDSPPV